MGPGIIRSARHITFSCNGAWNNPAGLVRKGVGVGKVQGPGDPFNGIDVSLVDKSTGSVVMQSTSGSSGTDGEFVFNNVAVGSYSLFVDIAGVDVDTSLILEITPTDNPNVVNITVDSNGIIMDTTINLAIKTIISNEIAFNVSPNPFKGFSQITYEVKSTEIVNLEVYDIIGSKVVKIVDNDYQEQGHYKYTFDPSSTRNTSGNYIVKLQIGYETFYKKLIQID